MRIRVHRWSLQIGRFLAMERLKVHGISGLTIDFVDGVDVQADDRHTRERELQAQGQTSVFQSNDGDFPTRTPIIAVPARFGDLRFRPIGLNRRCPAPGKQDLPNKKEVKHGVISHKIPAHAADLARGHP
jgi:hypothetical protein